MYDELLLWVDVLAGPALPPATHLISTSSCELGSQLSVSPAARGQARVEGVTSVGHTRHSGCVSGTHGNVGDEAPARKHQRGVSVLVSRFHIGTTIEQRNARRGVAYSTGRRVKSLAV